VPLHLVVARFPVVLFLVGAGADLLGAAMGSASTRRAADALLILGGVLALLAAAVVTGITLSGSAISHGP
jgi:uncharacterized membrane protein